VNSLPCPFCLPARKDIVFENTLWYARWDSFPATKGHLLVIPFRHCTGYFDTTAEEQASLAEMLFSCRKILDAEFSPAGYNIVINIGVVADQRVMHCHVHVIPRYSDPANNPPGGIQGIIFGEAEREAPKQ